MSKLFAVQHSHCWQAPFRKLGNKSILWPRLLLITHSGHDKPILCLRKGLLKQHSISMNSLYQNNLQNNLPESSSLSRSSAMKLYCISVPLSPNVYKLTKRHRNEFNKKCSLKSRFPVVNMYDREGSYCDEYCRSQKKSIWQHGMLCTNKYAMHRHTWEKQASGNKREVTKKSFKCTVVTKCHHIT